VAVGVLVGTAAGWALSGISVSASTAFQVRAKGIDQTPYQSDRLALTYARLLPEETSVQRLVGAEIHRSDGYVRTHLTMSAQEATPVVFARVSADSSAAALAGLHALTTALRDASDSSGSRLRATVIPLSEPTLSTGFSRTKALLLGVVGGFLVALTLMLTLERRDPRVDRLSDLTSIFALPVSLVTQESLHTVITSLHWSGAEERVEFVGVDTGRARRSIGRLVGTLGLSLTSASQIETTHDLDHRLNRALVVKRGTPVACVREAYFLSLDMGCPITTALFFCPKPLWSRATDIRYGLRAA